MVDRRNRPCPPGQVRPFPAARCQPRPFITTPTGGPASGLWSQGSSLPAPAPASPPSCVKATIFGDCFSLCTGVISGGAPGPVCGWTFIEPFGPLGGQFTFTPGVMSMDTAGATDFPIATKPLMTPLLSVFGISGRFSFTEYATPPNPNTTYSLVLNNFDLSKSVLVSIFGDGTLSVQAGSPASIPTYLGTWTPVPGAAHVVSFAVDGAGIPTLFIDGVPVPLVFSANVPSFSTSFPVNSINYGGGAGVAAAASSPLRSLFLTAGASGPATAFCCP